MYSLVFKYGRYTVYPTIHPSTNNSPWEKNLHWKSIHSKWEMKNRKKKVFSILEWCFCSSQRLFMRFISVSGAERYRMKEVNTGRPSRCKGNKQVPADKRQYDRNGIDCWEQSMEFCCISLAVYCLFSQLTQHSGNIPYFWCHWEEIKKITSNYHLWFSQTDRMFEIPPADHHRNIWSNVNINTIRNSTYMSLALSCRYSNNIRCFLSMRHLSEWWCVILLLF